MKKGQMVKAFEAAAFAMENDGDISEPVETAYGYHLIRLNSRNPEGLMPFESVKAQAMGQARTKYLTDYRSRYVRELQATPIEMTEAAVEAMAKRYFGENLELAPDYKE